MARNYKLARKNCKIKLNDAAEQFEVSQSALSGWESERTSPSIESLEKMADLYHTTTDYLLGRNSPVSDAPLPIETAMLMNGQPLWSPTYGWGLVQSSSRQLLLADGTTIPLADVKELYEVSAAQAIPPHVNGPALPREELITDRTVWLEPLSEDTYLREELRGWYAIRGNFAENQNGNRFPLNMYKVKWLAFSQAPTK